MPQFVIIDVVFQYEVFVASLPDFSLVEVLLTPWLGIRFSLAKRWSFVVGWRSAKFHIVDFTRPRNMEIDWEAPNPFAIDRAWTYDL